MKYCEYAEILKQSRIVLDLETSKANNKLLTKWQLQELLQKSKVSKKILVIKKD